MNRLQVFEHSFLPLEKGRFEQHHFAALSNLNALHGYRYFDLKHNGVVFKQFVGVIQVAGLTIEILPKADRNEAEDAAAKKKWQSVLIGMLRVTNKLKIQQVGQAYVSRQSIHLLDLYFVWFLNEVQLLIHQGLIKQYYKETGNVKALKGKLEFAGHIQKNIVHKERFYTTYQVYDKDHLIHQILGQALDIIAALSKGNYLYSKCTKVQLDFPDVKPINASENTFARIPKSKKTAPYQTALEIARLIILNYAPNVSSGAENMLALLFDMNSLWEEYVLVRLKQAAADKREFTVYGQESKHFWNDITVRPDIVLTKGNEVFIIDTKWKNLDYTMPSTHDLRQMYVYNEYWNSRKSLLLCPSNQEGFKGFVAFTKRSDDDHHQCGLGRISVLNADGSLDLDIGNKILDLFL